MLRFFLHFSSLFCFRGLLEQLVNSKEKEAELEHLRP